MAIQNPLLPHLRLIEWGYFQDYKSKPGRGKTVTLPPRDRASHGSALQRCVEAFMSTAEARKVERQSFGLQAGAEGISIEFQSAPGFSLAFKSLDLPSQGIELLNVREVNNITYATCYVPDGKLQVLVNKIKSYLEENTIKGKAKNAPLIESIESIGLATFDALWTDEEAPPADDEMRWWEIWLRMDLPASAVFQRFEAIAQSFKMALSKQWIEFPGRLVIVGHASRSQLTTAIELLNFIAEIRLADRPPVLDHPASISEQEGFVETLTDRLQLGQDDVVIAILDTGISRTHPLIAPALAQEDMHGVHPEWTVNDHDGHGTSMAGLALYGDLSRMPANGPFVLPYRLESVKILPPTGYELLHESYGAITQQAVSYCEIAAPHRKRIVCKTVTTSSSSTGEPSSYSGAVDMSAFADGHEDARLYVISAGNTPDHHWINSPESNLTYGIERPGQAWNALTVGAYTSLKDLPATADYSGWQAISAPGELSPFSATSATWVKSKWPIKPEVLFEGGNAAKDEAGLDFGMPNTLQLLTTRMNHQTRPLGYTAMTSAATAQAAKLAATIQAEYLTFWPQTVRGLIVHHADWTPAQRAKFVTSSLQVSRELLLRTCGYGVPQEEKAIHSVRNRVCIVAQETVQPFKRDGSVGAMNKCRIFSLPWPKEVLFGLAEKSVRLRVTLSYFVEPSPAKRGWLNRYRYASHGLRFDLRRNNETAEDFNKRVNASMREKDEEIDSPDDAGWFLGHRLRTLGSIHSDQWSGMAIDLANRDLIAVYPVIGWWREGYDSERCEREVRFSLLLTLESDDETLDLYSAIQTELSIPINVEQSNVLGSGV